MVTAEEFKNTPNLTWEQINQGYKIDNWQLIPPAPAISMPFQTNPIDVPVINPTLTPVVDTTNINQNSMVPPANVQNQPVINQPPVNTTQVDTTVVKTENTPNWTTKTTEKPIAPIVESTPQEVLQNLSEWFKNAPQLFNNQQTYNQAYWYDTASPEKKQVMDAYFKSTQTKDAEWLFNILATWWKVLNPAIKESPEYLQATKRLDNYNKFKNFSEDQFKVSLTNWLLLPWTQTYNDLIKDPATKLKIDKANSLNNLNGKTINTDEAVKNTMSDMMKNSPLWKALEDWFITAEEANTLTTSPEINSMQWQVLQYKNDYDTLLNNYNNIRTEVENELKWKDVTRWAREALIWERMKNQKVWLDIARDLYNNNLGALTDMKKEKADLFTTNLWLYQDQQKQNQVEQQAATAFERQKQMADYNANLWLATSQAEFEQKLEQQTQLANDPVTGVQNIVDTYTKLWILPTRSTQEIIADVQNQVSQGKPLWQALSELNQSFQSKPEYKAIAQNQWLDTQIKQSQLNNINAKISEVWSKLDDKTLYNQATWQTKTIWEWATADSYSVAQTAQSVDDWTKYWQCGKFVNDVIQNNWWNRIFWNSLESKIANKNSDTPEVWSIIIMKSDKFPTNWHVWIVTSIQWDNIIVKDSNWNWKEQVSEHNVKISDWNILGYYNPSLWKQTTTWNLSTLWQFMKDNQDRWVGYSKDDVDAFNEKIDRFIKNGDENWMVISYRKMLMWDKSFKDEFDNTQKFTRALDDVSKMIGDYEKSWKTTNALKWVAEKVARKLWITTDTALAQLQTQMWFTLANYIRSISWTAASDVEVQRLMGNMAQIWNVKDLNTALVTQAKNNATSSLKSMIDTRMYGMPEDLKPKIFGDIYWTSTNIWWTTWTPKINDLLNEYSWTSTTWVWTTAPTWTPAYSKYNFTK